MPFELCITCYRPACHLTCNHFYATIANIPCYTSPQYSVILHKPRSFSLLMSKVVTNTTCTTPSETNMQQGLQSEGHQTCFCGRSFLGQSAFTNHSRTCRKTKKRLSNALEKAKETWTLNKRRRLDPSGSVGNESPSAGLIQVATQHITEVCYKLLKPHTCTY